MSQSNRHVALLRDTQKPPPSRRVPSLCGHCQGEYNLESSESEDDGLQFTGILCRLC
jgi:hypothetical protein